MCGNSKTKILLCETACRGCRKESDTPTPVPHTSKLKNRATAALSIFQRGRRLCTCRERGNVKVLIRQILLANTGQEQVAEPIKNHVLNML